MHSSAPAAQPVPGQDDVTWRAGGGYTARLCRLSCIAAATAGGRLLERSRPRRVLASGVLGMSRKPRRGDLLLAAGLATRPLTGVVCISMWITCAQRHQACARTVEMLGIPLSGRAHKRVLNWVDTIRTLCMQRNQELSTRYAAKPHKYA